MGVKVITCFISALLIYLLINKQKHLNSETVHQASKDVTLSQNGHERPYYTTGSLKNAQIPKPTAIDYLSRKRINSFILNHYNHYRFQMTFIDLAYTSQFRLKISNEDPQLFDYRQKIGFSLSENFLDGKLNFQIQKPHFRLKVRQYIDEQEDLTYTIFNITSFEDKISNFSANLTHIIRNQECFTSVRSNQAISHKCYGGLGAGRIRIERRMMKNGKKSVVSNIYNSGYNLTRASFDGLRGSDMHWNYVWGTASGFSKPEFYSKGQTIEKQRYLGLNFGKLNGDGQDFMFMNGQIKPLVGSNYMIDEDMQVGENITFSSDSPKIHANFNIVQKHIQRKDLGLAYIDMVLFYGLWNGYIEDDQGNEVGFYEIAGLVETSDSCF